MLDLKLDTFLTLCETRNYTKTANNLNITQPAVSQHIKSLEKYYNTKLFYFDKHRRLHLTKHGKVLRCYAQTMKSDSQIVKQLLTLPPKQPNELRLGAVATVGECFAPQMIAKYLQLYPDSKVSMYLDEIDALLEQLKNGRIQLCIIDTYCSPQNFSSHELFEAHTICICSPKHPLAGATINFNDLNKYRLIFRENESNSHRNLEQLLHSYNQNIHNFQSYVEVGTINTVQRLVMENIGISFVYDFVVQKKLDQGMLSQIYIRNFSSHTMFNLVWMKDSFFTSANMELLKICQSLLHTPAPI